ADRCTPRWWAPSTLPHGPLQPLSPPANSAVRRVRPSASDGRRSGRAGPLRSSSLLQPTLPECDPCGPSCSTRQRQPYPADSLSSFSDICGCLVEHQVVAGCGCHEREEVHKCRIAFGCQRTHQVQQRTDRGGTLLFG